MQIMQITLTDKLSWVYPDFAKKNSAAQYYKILKTEMSRRSVTNHKDNWTNATDAGLSN